MVPSFLTFTSVNHKVTVAMALAVHLCVCVCTLNRFSRVQLFATLWTVACQAPLSVGFARQEYGVDCHSLLQGIFQTQGLNPGLLHCRQILHHLNHQGSPNVLYNLHIY